MEVSVCSSALTCLLLVHSIGDGFAAFRATAFRSLIRGLVFQGDRSPQAPYSTTSGELFGDHNSLVTKLDTAMQVSQLSHQGNKTVCGSLADRSLVKSKLLSLRT